MKRWRRECLSFLIYFNEQSNRDPTRLINVVFWKSIPRHFWRLFAFRISKISNAKRSSEFKQRGSLSLSTANVQPSRFFANELLDRPPHPWRRRSELKDRANEL